MEEVKMSNPGESRGPEGNHQIPAVRAGGNPVETVRGAVRIKGNNAKVPGSEFSGLRWGEGRRNSEPTSKVKGGGLTRAVRNLPLRLV